MAEFTGGGVAVAFAQETTFPTAIRVSGVTLGEQTRPTLEFSPTDSDAQLHHPGDTYSARVITIVGTLDISNVPLNGPNLEGVDPGDGRTRAILDTCTVTYQNGATYVERGYYTSLGAVEAINNQLITQSVEFQADNQGDPRGWTAAP